MVNARLCETAILISFPRARALFSLAKDIGTPRRRQRKIWDDETPEIWLKFCETRTLWGTISHPYWRLTFSNHRESCWPASFYISTLSEHPLTSFFAIFDLSYHVTILAGIYCDPTFFGSDPVFVNPVRSDPSFNNPVRSGPIRSGFC